jgi:hypothetical protein
MLKTILLSLTITFSFNGCIVGKVAAAPFKVAGTVVETVVPF